MGPSLSGYGDISYKEILGTDFVGLKHVFYTRYIKIPVQYNKICLLITSYFNNCCFFYNLLIILSEYRDNETNFHDSY